MRYVLDASVAIKLYAPEPDSSDAVRWLEADHDFLAPDIFLVEVMQALLRHHREGRLTEEDLLAAGAEIVALVSSPHASAELMPSALSLAKRLTHRLHDCTYLALAERIGTPLLTADVRLADKVRRASLPVAVTLLSDPPPP